MCFPKRAVAARANTWCRSAAEGHFSVAVANEYGKVTGEHVMSRQTLLETASGSAGRSSSGKPPLGGQRRVLLIVLSVGIVVGGIGLLLSDSSSFEYYKHVDEVTKDSSAWQNKRLQLHGYVVPGSIKKRLNRDVQKLEYKFQIENCGAVAEAYFAGVVPDTFKDGAEVVLKGQFHGPQFTASEVMAKCPSKYQQAGAAHPGNVERCSRDTAGKGN